MKKLPDWAERIPLIRAALTKITTEFIDRRQIGELFGVSSYQAGKLIRDMGPMLHGNSFVVDAQDIRKLLSEMERDREICDLRRRLALIPPEGFRPRDISASGVRDGVNAVAGSAQPLGERTVASVPRPNP
jgi:hypothetical protein